MAQYIGGGGAASADSVNTAAIIDKAVTLPKMADLAASTFVGRYTQSTGVPEAITDVQMKELLSITADTYTATTAPTATNDETEGWKVGSKWGDATNDKVYFCLDPTEDAAVWLEIVDVDTARTFSTMQGMSFTTLADGTTSWDMSSTTNNVYILLEENTTLGFPTNLRAGSGIIKIAQDGTGSWTFGWNASYKFAGGSAPTVTSTASGIDYFSYICDGTDVVIFTVGQAVATA